MELDESVGDGHSAHSVYVDECVAGADERPPGTKCRNGATSYIGGSTTYLVHVALSFIRIIREQSFAGRAERINRCPGAVACFDEIRERLDAIKTAGGTRGIGAVCGRWGKSRAGADPSPSL